MSEKERVRERERERYRKTEIDRQIDREREREREKERERERDRKRERDDDRIVSFSGSASSGLLRRGQNGNLSIQQCKIECFIYTTTRERRLFDNNIQQLIGCYFRVIQYVK